MRGAVLARSRGRDGALADVSGRHVGGSGQGVVRVPRDLAALVASEVAHELGHGAVGGGVAELDEVALRLLHSGRAGRDLALRDVRLASRGVDQAHGGNGAICPVGVLNQDQAEDVTAAGVDVAERAGRGDAAGVAARHRPGWRVADRVGTGGEVDPSVPGDDAVAVAGDHHGDRCAVREAEAEGRGRGRRLGARVGGVTEADRADHDVRCLPVEGDVLVRRRPVEERVPAQERDHRPVRGGVAEGDGLRLLGAVDALDGRRRHVLL